MNPMKWWMTVLAAGALTTLAVADGDEAPVHTAPQMEKPATIDGVVGPDEYPAAVMKMNEGPDRFALNGPPAEARAFHDGKNLYVVIAIPVESSDNLTENEYWSMGDGVEVCFRLASEAKDAPVFVVQGFVTGKHAGTMHGGASQEQAAKLQEAVKFAAKKNPTSWVAEWAIPLEAAGIEFKPGLKLAFNLGAWRSETFDWIIWRGAMGPTFRVENAGILVLEGAK
jgi:hypothetical protein